MFSGLKKISGKGAVTKLALLAAMAASLPAAGEKPDALSFVSAPYALADETHVSTANLLESDALLTSVGFGSSNDPVSYAANGVMPADDSSDGSQIMGINIKWLTQDSARDNEGNPVSTTDERLFLATSSNAEMAMTFQIEVEFSGQYDYKPGDIRITIPAQVWHARKLSQESNGLVVGSIDPNLMIGSMDLPVPAAPSTKADFNWELIDGNYVLTNTCTVGATSSYTFKIAIRDLLPMDVVDMSVSEPISARVDLKTNQGNVITRSSGSIDAQVDTIAKLTDVHKTGEVFEQYYSGMLSDKQLANLPAGTNPEDYIYVKWSSYHFRTNNQPFSLEIEDTISEAYELVDGSRKHVTDGIFLGANGGAGTISDNTHYEANISNYSTTAADGVMYGDAVYMWSAYRKDAFEVPSARADQKVYYFDNHVEWTLTETDQKSGNDERKVTSDSANATVLYSPIAWARPVGNFGVDKWTESLRSKDWLYGYALNRIDQGMDADMSFIVRTTGYGYPWTSDETRGFTYEQLSNAATNGVIDQKPLDPEKFGKLGWKQVTEDFDTFFNFENTALTGEDFQFKSLEINDPYKMRFGKDRAGRWDYIADDTLPNPDLKIEYKVEGDDKWHAAATASWGINGRGAIRFVDVGEGVVAFDRTVIFPANVTDIRHTFVSNVFGGQMASQCDTAMIRWDVYPTISLKPSDRIKGIVEALFEANDLPETKFKNDVTMDAYGWVGADGVGELAYGNDFDYSRATLAGAGYGVWLEKSVDYNPANVSAGGDNDVVRQQVTLHYKGVLTEQSTLKDRTDYEEAVKAGVIPAETSGVFYDLLPENVVPKLGTVKLRPGDTITNMYTVPNYKGTNRILLVVEAELTPVPVYDARTMAGYSDQPQITFDAIYSWRDLDSNESKNVTNYMAFESTVEDLFEGTLGSIDGQLGEPDDPTAGNNATTPDMPEDIADALTGLNPNSKPDDNRFVYGKVDVGINVVTYTASNLDKMVSDDLVGIWTQGLDGQEQVSVYEGLGYTYRLRVSSSVRATKDIVIFDSLENYFPDGVADPANKLDDYQHIMDRKDWLGEWEGKGQWRGTLKAVDLSDFVAAGVAPRLYYSVIESGPVFPDTDVDSTGNAWADLDVFNLNNTAIWQEAQLDENGWWTVPDGVNVTGVALDATKTPDGEDFILLPNHSIAAYLKMKAPDDNEDEDTFIAKGAYARSSNEGDKPVIDWAAATDPENNMYAYNNTYLRHRQSDESGEQWNDELRVIYNDYTRVGIMPEIIVLEKKWDDHEDHDRMRPESVTVIVKRKVLGAAGEAEVVKDADGNPITAVLSEANGWKASFEQLDVVNEDGVRYIYSFEEAPVEGYTSKVEFVSSNAYRLVNVHPKETINIEGVKTWEDSGNELGYRPTSIVLELYCDGKYVTSQTVYPDADGNWSYAFKDLEKYAEGRVEHVYTIEEEYVPKYEFDDSDLAAVKNIYNPFGNLEVIKNLKNATEVSSTKSFSFNLELYNGAAPLTGVYKYDIVAKDSGEVCSSGEIAHGGKVSITAAQKLVVHDLPSESTYRVIENEKAGFLSTSKNAYGQIMAGRTQQAVFTNVYSASGYAVFNAKKSLTGREMMNRQFSFQMIDKTAGSENYGKVINTVRNEEPEALKDEESGKQIGSTADVLFGSIFYTEADHGKTFTYELKEIAEDKAGYAFDQTVYTVNVTVIDNGNGTLNIEKEITANGETVDEVEFLNVYEAEGELILDAAKVLHGRGLKANEFEFELYESDAQGTKVKLLETVKNAADGKIIFSALNFDQNAVSLDPDQPKRFYYYINEVHGDDSSIMYDNDGVYVVVSVYDNGDGTLAFAIDGQSATVIQPDCPECVDGIQSTDFVPPVDGVYSYSDYHSTHVIKGWYYASKSEGTYKEHANWIDYEPYDNEKVKLELCRICRGIQSAEGAACSNCFGTGIEPGSYFALEEDVKDSFESEYKTYNNENYLIIITDSLDYFCFRTVPEYFGPVENECHNCDGKGYLDKQVTIGGDPAERILVNEVIPVGLRAAKLLDGAAPQDDVFKFTLTDNATNQLIETKSSVNGEVVFTPINYNQEGSYTYIIAEVKGNQNGITYDEKKYEVTVNVTLQNGQYVAEYIYPDDQVPVFKNASTPGALKIEKTVSGANENNENQAFAVEISFTGHDFKPWNGNVAVNGTATAVTNGKLVINTLAKNNPILIKNIPTGVSFSAKEIGSYPGWTLDTDVEDGKIQTGATNAIVFNNKYNATGEAVIELNKTLTGRELMDQEFEFELLDGEGSVVDTTHNDANGVIRFAPLTFTAAGTYTYTVREKAGEDDTITYSTEVTTVTIKMTDKDGKGTLTAEVTYSDEDKTFTNEVKTGSLNISKTAVSTYQGHAQQSFEFTVTLADKYGNPLTGTYTKWVGNQDEQLTVEGGVVKLSLKGGDSVTIAGLPDGAQYTVAETKVDGFRVEAVGAEGTIEANATASAAFTNTYRAKGEYQLVAQKSYRGAELEDGQFTFVLEDEDGVVETVTNDSYGAVKFSTLSFDGSDVGRKTYTVYEVAGDDESILYDAKVYTVTLTITDQGNGELLVEDDLEGETILFENTFWPTAEIVFEGTKTLTGREMNENDRFTFEIWEDEELVQRVTNSADGTINYEPIVYTIDDLGEHVYTVKEAAFSANGVTSDDTEYTITVNVVQNADGSLSAQTEDDIEAIDFVNEYNLQVSANVEAIKYVNNVVDADFANRFTFVLEDENGNVVQGKQNAADGTVKFTPLTFTEEVFEDAWTQEDGSREVTFIYMLYEQKGKEKYFDYDRAVYRVYVILTEDGNGNTSAVVEYYKITAQDTGNQNAATTQIPVFCNGYDAKGEVQFSGSKTLTGKTLAAEMFSFELIGADGKVIETVKNDKDGKFAFSAIKYDLDDAGKTFTYTVKEKAGDMAGVTYDETVYTVTVEVTDNGDGTLTAKASDNAIELNFTNSYAAEGSVSFEGSKILENKTLEAEMFSFQLIGADGKVIETVKNDKGGKFAFSAITYKLSDVGEYEYTVKEVIPEETNGVTYDETVYTVTVKVEDGGDGTLTVTASDNATKLNFTNSYSADDEEVQFSGSKTLTGKALTENAFSFELIDADDNVIETVKNDKDGKFAFSEITYKLSDVGEYEYTVKEVIPEETNGVTYDETVYTVTVKVEDGGDGTLTVTASDNATKLNFTNSYSADDEEVQFSGSKTLTGKALTENAFSFELIDADDNVIETVKNDKDGKFAFSEITYKLSDVGEYEYTVKEVIPEETNGVTYDETVYTVTVKVVDNGDGTLTVTASDNATKLNFTNSYSADDEEVQFSGSKTLTGKKLEADMFSFQLTDAEGNVIETVKNNANGEFAFSKITYTLADVGEYTYTVKEVNDGQGGVTYDETVYTVTVKVEDNGDGTLKITKSENWNKLDFANSYNAAEEEVEFSGTKTLTGKALTENAFSFELVGADGNVIETVKNGADGSFEFDKITYTLGDAGKTFTYTVKEVNDAQGGVTYDETVYTVTVKVEDNGDGTLKITKSENWNKLDFANSYNAAEGEVEFSGEKTLTGKALKADDFSFQLIDADDNVIETVKNDKDGKFAFSAIEYDLDDAGQTFTYTVKEVKGSMAGVTYDETVYTVTVEVADDGSGELTVTASDNATALNFTNVYTAEGETQFSGTKTLTGKTLEAEMFSFELIDADGKVIETVKNDKEGKFAFTAIKYDLADAGETFTYTVKEVKGKMAGVTYDDTVYTVTVEVTDNGDGTLTAKASDNATELNFTNSYAAEGSVSFEGSKILENKTLEAEMFSFQLIDDDGNVIETVKNDKEGKFAFSAIEYDLDDAGKTFTYTVKEVNDAQGGVTYDETVYTVTVEVADNGSGELTVTASDNATALNFTNVYEAEGETQFSGKKTLTGKALKADDFSFELIGADGKVIETVKNDKDGKFAFSAIEYDLDDAGQTFTYTVKEVNDAQGGVTYDEIVYTVTVKVEDNGDGTLKITKSENWNKLDFANSYNAAEEEVEFSGSKTFEGKTLEAGMFSFELLDAEGTVIETVKSNANGEFAFSKITYKLSDVGEYEYTVKEVIPEETNGVTYDETVYTVTVKVEDNGNGTLKVTASDNATELDFTNSYDAEGSVIFEGRKNLIGREFVETDKFTFIVKENDRVVDTVELMPGSGSSAAIGFAEIAYGLEDVGMHTYTVTEVKGDIAGMVYDETSYEVKVRVSDTGNGKLAVLASDNHDSLDFTNEYVAEGELLLTAVKLVNGETPDETQVYEFALVDENGETLQTVRNAGEEIVFDAIKYDLSNAGKTYTYSVIETSESTEEMAADDTVYTVTVEIADNGEGELDIQTVIAVGEEVVDEIFFNNLTYTTLTISKTVDNIYTEEAFDITVHIYEMDGTQSERSFPYSGDLAGEIRSGDTISLAHGQFITIEKLVPGMSYKVEEKESIRYTTSVNDAPMNSISDECLQDGSNVEFINSIVTTSLSVRKQWEGYEGDSIILTLYANGEKLLEQPGYTREGDTYTYENLPMYDAKGNLILYGVKEKYVDGYMTLYINVAPYEDETDFVYDGGTIINRASTQIRVKKVWSGLADGETPPQITLTLYCNGEKMSKRTPKPNADGWYVYNNLPLMYRGKKAVYTVVEEYMPGYYTYYTKPDGTEVEYASHGDTIVNVRMPATGDKSSVAAWMAMLMVSSAGLLVLLKRRKA